MKNINDFINLVAEMREAQKQYFASHKTHFLIRSKILEANIDDKLEAHFAERRKPKSPDSNETLTGGLNPH